MKLNLLYLPNETGEKLLESSKIEWEKVSSSEVELRGLKYLLIEINDKNNGYERTVNTPQAIRLCSDEEAISGILATNRIAYGNSNEDSIIRRYNVLICDNNIISTQVKYPVKNKEQTRYIKETENTKVIQMARRIFQLLGLDMGMINISLTAKRRWRVIQVDPSPSIRDKDFDLVMRRIKNIYNTEEHLKNNEIKMGADPEFMLFNSKNNKMLSASDYFPRDGQVGCDNIRIPNRQQRPIAEIRPKPDESPLKLVENIRQSLIYASKLAPYQNVGLLAGSQPTGGYSIGGHIHFSRIHANSWLLIALDNYLGIPIFLIEQPATASKRRKKYGFLGDYRSKDHGGFEYRTPGSWLVSKEIATAVLCLAKIVASSYPYLNQNHLNNIEAQKAFYNGNPDYFREIFPKLWKDIEKTERFPEYEEQLNIIPSMVNKGLHWDEKIDMRKTWNITITNRRRSLNDNSENSEKSVRPATGAGNTTTTTTTSSRRIQRSSTVPAAAPNQGAGVIVQNNANRRRSSTRVGSVTAPQQIRRAHSIR
ncbi:MAG: hypothetical protein PHE26_08045 [Syntrophomonadaceae bacterium]|nr:hypothetical protein [Syntrophomonadaceae bacterium]